MIFLRSVQYLDFASKAFSQPYDPKIFFVSRDMEQPDDPGSTYVLPPPLCPAAKHIRLAGQMSFAFVRAFLLSNQPAGIISLDLDNLQDLGQQREGWKLGTSLDLCLVPEREDLNVNRVLRHPGPMRGHLRRLEGRCTGLKRLILRSVGQDLSPDYTWSPIIDAARYQEWASFIKSVRHTLQHLTLEFGLAPEEDCVSQRPGSWYQYGRPMVDRFMDHLLPTLLTEHWPCLTKIEIYGIGAPPRQWITKFSSKYTALAQTVEKRLQESLGARVVVDVREYATKNFFHRDHGTYDSQELPEGCPY